MHTPSIDPYAWSFLALALAAIAWIDVRERRIPNPLVALIAVAGIAHAALIGGAWGFAAALAGVVAGLALLYFQFSRGWMGAGDVKLLGALGGFAGALGALYILIAASVIGGVLAVAALVRLGRAERAEVGHNVVNFAVTGGMIVPEPSRISRERGVPFGVALAVAGAAVTFLGLGR
jgi:prepilin peptidase CpaA